MAPKAISLKYQLLGEVEEFLEKEEMPCQHTKAGVVELINQISAYKEEGKALFPEVYIIDDINSIKNSLVNSELVGIGSAQKSSSIILKALKKCAPLAIGGWCIYILRKDDVFEYGLFRSGASIVTIPISQSLVDNGDEQSKLLLIRQVADKIVELKGVRKNTLIINFGIKSTSDLSPLDEQARFIEKILEDVDSAIKDQARIFLYRLFLYVMQNGHGNLCCVIHHKSEYPDFLTDGIILTEKLSFTDKILAIEKATSEDGGLNLLECNARLNGVFNLIAGMMMSDGITVFNNNGSVSSYNIFLKHPEDDENLKKVEGGARSRTYEVMRQKLSASMLAAYIQSQDGKTQTQIYA